MTRHAYVFIFVLLLATAFAGAQMRTPGGQTTGLGQQPGVDQPGMGHPPGVPEQPGGMGNDHSTKQTQPRVDDASLERLVH